MRQLVCAGFQGQGRTVVHPFWRFGFHGSGRPYAIGAKFAHPDRPVVALVGDGAMQMNNMAELITVQKYWRSWADPRLIVCVFNNQDLNEVTWEQRVMEGNPKFEASQDIPDFA